MDKKIAKLWVKALRSGDYEQGRHQLRNEHSQFCCLGVLCNLHAQAHPDLARLQLSPFMYMGTSINLPISVRQWAGLAVGREHEFAEMNDTHKWTFKEIAKYIEDNRKYL